MAKNKVEEPQYIMSALNTPMLNYKTYVMSKKEKIITFLLAFLIGGGVGLTFYGGQFRDADGLATQATQISNVIIFCLVGIIAAIVFFPMRRVQLQEKRRLLLTKQFRALLEALAVCMSSGMNMNDSLRASYEDLKSQYTEDSYICAEVQEMLDGLENNVPIEETMAFLGERSQIGDIKNFGMVFTISYRAGGNIKDMVRRTSSILGEKMKISEEIETTITSNKTQFSFMMVVPVMIVLMLKSMSSSFAASFATPIGVVVMTIAIGIFIGAYKLGQKIMDIKG